MTDNDTSPPSLDAAIGTVHAASTNSRMFPCERCGAELRYDIGVASLQCPYCNYVKELVPAADAHVVEQDYEAMLAVLATRHDGGAPPSAELREVRCHTCGGTATFSGNLTSAECPYCGTTWQQTDVRASEQRIAIDGLVPFRVEYERAAENLRAWVKSRWFAPNEFTRRGVDGRFQGVFLPFWTFDALTYTVYRGQRGDYYYVTVGSGKNKRQERRTRWTPASGQFQRFFDDVLVCAANAVPVARVKALEPWPLGDVVVFRHDYLAGFLARTYDCGLADSFVKARQDIDAALRVDVHGRIGGDTQRIEAMDTTYSAITFKQLLLPLWMLAYRFHDKPYQVLINACTGEVQGDRPYSWIKITLAALAGAIVVGGLIAFFVANQ
jgi:DNA-directed RNA polymerase subunit RPC12/RpoP